MFDIEDQMIMAIQSYAQSILPGFENSSECIMALADQMAPHIIKNLGLKQEWAIAVASINEDGFERVDDISYDDTNRQRVVDHLAVEVELDKEFYINNRLRRYLVSRLYTGWEEEKDDPTLDAELVALVAEDAR